MAVIVANAPKPTLPGIPVGQSLDEGFRITVTFAANPNVTLWEVDIQPPGLQVGKAINKTSQRNNLVKTKAPPYLIEITDASGTFEFNSLSYRDCAALIRVKTSVTYRFPDGYMLCHFGYLEDFKPESFADEKMPLAKCIIVCTNVDPATGLEAMPALYDPNGNAVAFGLAAIGNV